MQSKNSNCRGLSRASDSQIEKYISATLDHKWNFYQYKNWIFFFCPPRKSLHKWNVLFCRGHLVLQKCKIKKKCAWNLEHRFALDLLLALQWTFDTFNIQMAYAKWVRDFIIHFVCRDTDNNNVILSTFMRPTLSDNRERDSQARVLLCFEERANNMSFPTHSFLLIGYHMKCRIQ